LYLARLLGVARKGEECVAGAPGRSDSLFTADEGGHRIDGAGVWRIDDMEAAVRRADADPVDTKFGPPSIVRPPHVCLDWLHADPVDDAGRPESGRHQIGAAQHRAPTHMCLDWLWPVNCALYRLRPVIVRLGWLQPVMCA